MKKNAEKPQRIHSMGLWLTVSEKFIIDNKAKRCGLSNSSYVRKMAIEGKVMERLTREDREMIRELIDMSNEVHEIVLMGKKESLLVALPLFERVRDKFDHVFNKLAYDK